MHRVLTIGILVLTLTSLPQLSRARSILEIPAGSIFVLQEEITIPPNRNFAILSHNRIDDELNTKGQILHTKEGNFIGNRWPEPKDDGSCQSFDNYISPIFATYGTSARRCREQQHRFLGANTSGIHIGKGRCAPSNHTLAALVLTPSATGKGVHFTDEAEFRVKEVSWQDRGNYTVTKIAFDHRLVAGIMIVSTRQPEEIPLSALEAPENSSGEEIQISGGVAVSEYGDFGGYFYIHLPEINSGQ